MARFKDLGILQKVLIISLSGVFVVGAVSAVMNIFSIREEAQDAIITKSRAIVLNVEAVREEMQHMWDIGLLNVDLLKSFAAEGRMDKVLASVPVFNAMNSAKKKAEEGGYQFRVPKIQPRNLANEPTELEARVLERLQKGDLKEYYEVDPAANAVRYFRPVVLTESCLLCHGDPATSQAIWGRADGTDPSGGKMEGWKAGEVHGAFQVISSLAPVDKRVTEATIFTLLVTLGLLGLLAFIMVLSIRQITRPLQACAALAGKVEQGILTESLDIDQKDEVGRLASSLNSMRVALKYKADVLEAVSNGDLTHEITGIGADDHLGNSLIRMQDSLRNLLTRIAMVVEKVGSGAQALSEAGRQLADGTTEQAASIEEINSSLGLIHQQSKGNFSQAQNGKELSGGALERARQGYSDMLELIKAMDSINESFRSIKLIVRTIDDLAFQTNLLSLNANIEAARAGRFGKGFAVVADEVRALANKSAESVVETTNMVDASFANVEHGNKKAKDTMEVFRRIVEDSEKLSAIIAQVASSAQEQAAAIEQVNQGLDQIDKVTQANAAGSEESSSSADELSHLARELAELIARFKLNSVDEEDFVPELPAPQKALPAN